MHDAPIGASNRHHSDNQAAWPVQFMPPPSAPPPLSLLFPAGTGRTGFLPVPPNNYPFYKGDSRYTPVVQPDGGQLSGARQPHRGWGVSLIPTARQAGGGEGRMEA
jgi:hypothetical protein